MLRPTTDNSVVTVRTDYTDRAAAAGRQVSTDVSRIEGCHGVSVTGPHGR
jgi:hypothetical protein